MGGSNEAKGAEKRGRLESNKQQRDMLLRERERQRDISSGKKNIDRAFGRFSDAYYDRFKNDYTGNYFPQLDDQYQQTAGKLSAKLGDRGLDESTVGAYHQGKLSEQHLTERSNVANQAADAANALRGNVEKTKTSLYGLNEASADPKGINARAVGEASSLVSPQAYSPIGQVFASALEPWSYYAQAAGRSPGARYKSPLASGSGSGSVVR
jgi:hypothetical protein